MTATQQRRLITAADVAERTTLSVKSVYRLPFRFKLLGRVVFFEDEVDAYIAAQHAQAAAAHMYVPVATAPPGSGGASTPEVPALPPAAGTSGRDATNP